ncbi:hypothetical protein [Mycobacterium sp.]
MTGNLAYVAILADLSRRAPEIARHPAERTANDVSSTSDPVGRAVIVVD